jgi:O-antigen/teichoic acid export membrane protein
MSSHDSIKIRYAYKLAGTLFSTLSTGVQMLLVPKAIGIFEFGRFEYVNSVTSYLFIALTLSVPSAQSIWIARKKRTNLSIETNLTFGFYILVGICIFLAVSVMQLTGTLHVFWPDINIKVVLLGIFLGLTFFLNQNFDRVADAKALTRKLEIIKLFQVTVRFVVIISFIYLKKLTLLNYLGILAAHSLVFSLVKLSWLKKINVLKRFQRKKNKKRIRIIQLGYLTYVKKYITPLIFYSTIVFMYTYWDKWLLQFISGSYEQAIFGIASRASLINTAFTSAFIPIVMREFSQAHASRKIAHTQKMFHYITFVQGFAAVISMGFMLTTSELLSLVIENPTRAHVITFTLMAFYPIHQVYGQFFSTYYLSSDRTSMLTKINSVSIFISIPVSYFLLAPKDMLLPGLNLGSLGIAVKQVVLQLFSTNILLIFILKHIKIPYSKFFTEQFILLLLSLGIVVLGFYISDFKPSAGYNAIAREIGVSEKYTGISYTLLFKLFFVMVPLMVFAVFGGLIYRNKIKVAV